MAAQPEVITDNSSNSVTDVARPMEGLVLLSASDVAGLIGEQVTPVAVEKPITIIQAKTPLKKERLIFSRPTKSEVLPVLAALMIASHFLSTLDKSSDAYTGILSAQGPTGQPSAPNKTYADKRLMPDFADLPKIRRLNFDHDKGGRSSLGPR